MSDPVVVADLAEHRTIERPLTGQEAAQAVADAEQGAARAAVPDPLIELMAAVQAADSVAKVRNALVQHLPRALGRGR